MKTRSSYFAETLIALAVVVAALALLGGLAMALTGWRWQQPRRTFDVDFPDVAGIHKHSQVRYAGAPAGTVVAIRHLSAAERLASARPDNAIRVTVGIDEGVPQIPRDAAAALGSDTLLSEKFIALDAGTAGAAVLQAGDVIQGIPSPTFDAVMRSAADLVQLTERVLPAVDKELPELLRNLSVMSESARELATETRDIVVKLDRLVSENETALADSLQALPQVIAKIDALLTATQSFVGSNEKEITSMIRDVRALSRDVQTMTSDARKLIDTLANGRPTRLIWVPEESGEADRRREKPPAAR